ncbi:MAG TPA: hypothetical protein VHZ07_11145 [Bryobacteraceae bacterium]|jgi:hypothetical protein|nr:hypothetical protein [Bryobacteraceae bacterium]
MTTDQLRPFLALPLLLAALATARSASGPYPVQWSPKLGLKSLADIDARLHRSFGDVFEGKLNGKPVTVSNCAEYLADSREHFAVAGGEQAFIVLHSDAVDCIALEALKAARPAKASYLGGFHLNASSLTYLSPLLAPAVSNEQLAKARQAASSGDSWQRFVPAARAKPARQAGAINVSQPNWETTITEYGRADFTGDGLADLLVRSDYAATKGTYRNSRLFLLSRKNETAVLEVVKEYNIR